MNKIYIIIITVAFVCVILAIDIIAIAYCIEYEHTCYLPKLLYLFAFNIVALLSTGFVWDCRAD